MQPRKEWRQRSWAVATRASEMAGATTERSAEPMFPIAVNALMILPTVPKTPRKTIFEVVARTESKVSRRSAIWFETLSTVCLTMLSKSSEDFHLGICKIELGVVLFKFLLNVNNLFKNNSKVIIYHPPPFVHFTEFKNIFCWIECFDKRRILFILPFKLENFADNNAPMQTERISNRISMLRVMKPPCSIALTKSSKVIVFTGVYVIGSSVTSPIPLGFTGSLALTFSPRLTPITGISPCSV